MNYCLILEFLILLKNVSVWMPFGFYYCCKSSISSSWIKLNKTIILVNKCAVVYNVNGSMLDDLLNWEFTITVLCSRQMRFNGCQISIETHTRKHLSQMKVCVKAFEVICAVNPPLFLPLKLTIHYQSLFCAWIFWLLTIHSEFEIFHRYSSKIFSNFQFCFNQFGSV